MSGSPSAALQRQVAAAQGSSVGSSSGSVGRPGLCSHGAIAPVQGQSPGRCSVSWRAWRVRHPGYVQDPVAQPLGFQIWCSPPSVNSCVQTKTSWVGARAPATPRSPRRRPRPKTQPQSVRPDFYLGSKARIAEALAAPCEASRCPRREPGGTADARMTSVVLSGSSAAGQAVTTRISLVMPPTPWRRATSSNAASLSNWCLTSPFSVTQPSVTLTSIASSGTSTSHISA